MQSRRLSYTKIINMCISHDKKVLFILLEIMFFLPCPILAPNLLFLFVGFYYLRNEM